MKNVLLLFIVLITFSCSDKQVEINGIWLPEDLKWQPSNTGLPEIDSIRRDVYTDIIVFYGKKLSTGKASLYYYTDTDTIRIAYEAGEMLFNSFDCYDVQKANIISDNELLFDDVKFQFAANIDQNSRRELVDKLCK